MAETIERPDDDDEDYYSPEVQEQLQELLDSKLTIVEASWHRTPEFGFLMMKLSNGRRVLIPREELSQLRGATDEQAADLFVDELGYFLWWPQMDDGLLLENFVRDHPERVGVAAATEERRGVAA